MLPRITILGQGHIGSFITKQLSVSSGMRYLVSTADLRDGQDLRDPDILRAMVKSANVVIDTLPYYLNVNAAKAAIDAGAAYFNLTEDVHVTREIAEYAQTRAQKPVVPQCGLAPGMVSIIADRLVRQFDAPVSVKIRVGALPATPFNRMGYALTWNPDGLINEYCNPCDVIENGRAMVVDALDGHEELTINGVRYEAAYTSGGIGALTKGYLKIPSIQTVNYKTLRYPGHFAYMRMLRDDLGLAQERELFTDLFNRRIPHTEQDIVVIAIEVTGFVGGKFTRRAYKHTVSSFGEFYGTAIQNTTGHGVLAVVDAYLRTRDDTKIAPGTGGFTSPVVYQHEIPFDLVKRSPFASMYDLSSL